MLIAISNQSDQSAMYKWIARETKAVNREGDKQKGGSEIVVSPLQLTKLRRLMSTKLVKRLSGFSDCSRKGVRKVKDLYQFIVNTPEILEVAYNNIRTIKGALTRGTDEVTMDGHSFERSHEIMSGLKDGSYQPTPVRRIYIPKSNGKQRPLGMTNGTDKLVQEVCRIVLESIYEPIFSDYVGSVPKEEHMMPS